MKMIQLVTILLLGLEVRTALSQCDTNYPTVEEAITALDQLTLSVDQFTPGCVSQDCPSVSDLPCPYDSSSSFNITALTQVLNSVQSCMSSHGTLCGVAIDPIPVCTIGLYLQPFLAPSGINGTISLDPGTTSVTGLSHTTLTTDSNGYINVTINNLAYQGQVQANIGLEGSNEVQTVNNVPFSVTVNISLILTVTTRPKVSVQVTSKTISTSAQFGQLWTADTTQPILTIIQTLVDWATQAAYESSPIPNDIGNFIGTIFANALQTADSNCNTN